ncbi:substrate-binding domain-containing protein [Sorangium atrum]|uniref:Substrate-binding domain-containing protein n=1 Tax=Sorangium atrum TaxID=2995308 RepID=A0ABT5CAW0_9BACT|nr:substrate-binding domain-containing protein [Sorangium aterium]MDC0682945.1 substrate-binding domain-containing protein [Sorangium aterium]
MSPDRAIGIMCPDIWGSYVCELLGGIQSAAARAGYRVLAIRASPRDVHRLRLARDQVDGWIALIDAAELEPFLDDGRPVVTLSARPKEDARCPYVLPDNHGGALSAVRHLLDHGHERIVFAGHMAHEDIRQRFQAYRDALEERGISFDPDLVFDLPNNERASGRLAVQRLLEEGVTCTAMFMSADKEALGVLDAFAEAGIRVPEDIALVGFDDIEAARYASPPLTTVRQRFDRLGGTAAELLIDLLAGRELPCAGHIAPTTLVLRRSCGCSPAPALRDAPPSSRSAAAPASGPPSSRSAAAPSGALARELAALASASTSLDPSSPAEEAWAGATEVVLGLEAAVWGRPGPAAAALERAWREAAEQMPDIDQLLEMVDRLERAGQRMLSGAGDAAAERRVAAYIRAARRAMMEGRVAIEAARADYLNGLLDINLVIRETLLADAGGGGSKLSWLSAVQMSWGCLAVWEAPGDTGRALRIVESCSPGATTASPEAGARVAAEAFPRREWLPAAAQRDDHVLRLIPLRGEGEDRGVLAVCAPVSSPLGLDHRDMEMWVAMLTAALERAALIESLIEQEQQARAAYERERALADDVRQLGCPVIPLDQGVLLVPLVGAIDLERARHVLEVVLAELSRQEAEVLLMDITGVPFADMQVAASLMKTTRAALLLGAEVIVVGMRPQVAQGFIRLGIDLQGMTLHQTLGSALSALRGRRQPLKAPPGPRA